MQRPTDNLRADHAVTALGVKVLAALGTHVRHGATFPVADCASLLRFLREFVLGVHFRKESDLVGPAVAMRADEPAAALVGELLRLQDEVADLVHCLVLFWEPAGELTMAEREGFAETVAALESRMLRMQALEEQKLFGACDASVPADDQLDWIDGFAALESGRRSRSSWASQIGELAKKWLH